MTSTGTIPTTTAAATRGTRPGRASELTEAPFLRGVLRVDAAGTGAFGVFLLALGSLIDGPLGFPLSWSVPFGVAMLGGALALGLIAGYPAIPVRFVRSVVVFNAASTVALVALAFVDLMPLTTGGVVFFLVGALQVGVVATLQYVGWRRAGRGSPA